MGQNAKNMALSENVKKQALNAVAHKETTEQIRRFQKEYEPAPAPESSTKPSGPSSPGSIPDHVKKQAMDAVAHKETTAQIRLVVDNGSVSPTATPGNKSGRGEKIAELVKDGHNADSLHRTITKDNFDRGA